MPRMMKNLPMKTAAAATVLFAVGTVSAALSHCARVVRADGRLSAQRALQVLLSIGLPLWFSSERESVDRCGLRHTLAQ